MVICLTIGYTFISGFGFDYGRKLKNDFRSVSILKGVISNDLG